MRKYNVTGMSCAACSARVEKAVSAVEGVTECSVNFLTNSMNVDGTAEDSAIIAAVTAAGYGAELPDGGGKTQPKAVWGRTFFSRLGAVWGRRAVWGRTFFGIILLTIK